MSQRSSTTCPLHLKREIRYYCFNDTCTHSFECCILCVKSVHKTCDSAYQLDRQDIKNLTQKAQSIDSMAFESLRQAYSASVIKTKEAVFEIIDKKLAEMNNKCNTIPKFELQSLQTKKSNYFFSYDRSTKKITVTSAISANNKNCKNMIKILDQNLSKYMAEYKKNVTQYVPINKMQFIASDFNHHAYLKLADEEGKIVMNLPVSEEKYYLAISEKPIQSSLHFKVKVFNLNPTDRYVEMGFFNQSHFETYKDTHSGAFLAGGICFCGYRFKGFKGTTPSLNLDSTSGLKDDDEVYFKFDSNKKILTVYSKQYSWTHSSKVSFDPPYYLYFCLYFVNQKIEITHIN